MDQGIVVRSTNHGARIILYTNDRIRRKQKACGAAFSTDLGTSAVNGVGDFTYYAGRLFRVNVYIKRGVIGSPVWGVVVVVKVEGGVEEVDLFEVGFYCYIQSKLCKQVVEVLPHPVKFGS